MRYGNSMIEKNTHWTYPGTHMDRHGWVRAACGEIANNKQGEVDLHHPSCEECKKLMDNHNDLGNAPF